VSYSKLAHDPTNGLGNSKEFILNALSTTNTIYQELNSAFYKKALDSFTTFLTKFVGDTVKIQDGKGGLKVISAKEMIATAGKDVNFMQKFFTSVADNPDTLLQSFDKVVKAAKTQQRLKTIDMS
jgi:hypothetical protein